MSLNGSPMRRRVAWTVFLLALTLTVAGCQSHQQPCDCGVAEKELRAYTLKYLDAQEDLGNLTQRLKACQEER